MQSASDKSDGGSKGSKFILPEIQSPRKMYNDLNRRECRVAAQQQSTFSHEISRLSGGGLELLEREKQSYRNRMSTSMGISPHLIKNEILTESSTITEKDFESLMEREIRQANERNQLIEQIKEQNG